MTCGRLSPQEKAFIAVSEAFTDAALRVAAAALLAVFVLVIVRANRWTDRRRAAGGGRHLRRGDRLVRVAVGQVIRRCGHLEIAGQVITYVDATGQTMTLSR